MNGIYRSKKYFLNDCDWTVSGKEKTNNKQTE